MMRFRILAIILWAASTAVAQEPSKVEIAKGADGKFQLLRAGKPFFIKGACTSGHLDELKAAGGNSVRAWGTAKDPQLYDEAHKRGLTVLAGLWMVHERDGMNYADPVQVKQQFDSLKKYVVEHKKHPAIILWAVGYELQRGTENVDIWKAVEDVAKMIKQEDPLHPVMTILSGVDEQVVRGLKAHCPSLDLIGINAYASLPVLPDNVVRSGWDKPFVITEFGTYREWEAPKTSWDAAFEPNSTYAALCYESNYLGSIQAQTGHCLGSYVYNWGVRDPAASKPAWGEMFLPSGERLGAVDAMTLVWTGKPVSNHVPEIVFWETDAALREVPPGSEHAATVVPRDSDGDELRVRWEIRAETEAGRAESAAFTSSVVQGNDLVYTVPPKEGAYRLYVYVTDGRGGAATANVPFFSKAKK